VIPTTHVQRLSPFSLAPCKDAVKKDVCQTLKNIGLCKVSIQYMVNTCKFTCNFCLVGKLHVSLFCLISEEKLYISFETCLLLDGEDKIRFNTMQEH